jgi:hypothetical protein
MDEVRLPAGAEPYADELTEILLRIPPVWGRVVSIGPGWFGLIVELDHQLQMLDHNYSIQQIKEKFGSLRYYVEPSDVCQDPQAVQALISDAEQRSATICDVCGAAGQLWATRALSAWYSTRCPEHRQPGDILAHDWSAWAAVERPKQLIHQRQQFQHQHHGQRALLISERAAAFELAIPASYISDADIAAACAEQPWDCVWLDHDRVGEAFLNALTDRLRPEIAAIARRRQATLEPGKSRIHNRRPPAGLPTFYRLASGSLDPLAALDIHPSFAEPCQFIRGFDD